MLNRGWKYVKLKISGWFSWKKYLIKTYIACESRFHIIYIWHHYKLNNKMIKVGFSKTPNGMNWSNLGTLCWNSRKKHAPNANQNAIKNLPGVYLFPLVSSSCSPWRPIQNSPVIKFLKILFRTEQFLERINSPISKSKHLFGVQVGLNTKFTKK